MRILFGLVLLAISITIVVGQITIFHPIVFQNERDLFQPRFYLPLNPGLLTFSDIVYVRKDLNNTHFVNWRYDVLHVSEYIDRFLQNERKFQQMYANYRNGTIVFNSITYESCETYTNYRPVPIQRFFQRSRIERELAKMLSVWFSRRHRFALLTMEFLNVKEHAIDVVKNQHSPAYTDGDYYVCLVVEHYDDIFDIFGMTDPWFT